MSEKTLTWLNKDRQQAYKHTGNMHICEDRPL